MNKRQQFYRQHVKGGNVARTPLFRAALGSAMLLVMVIISCFSVLTTQNLVGGGDGSSVVMRWTVFLQPFDLMQGVYQGKAAVAVIVSWSLFVIYLIVGAFEVITPDSRGEDKLFKTVCYALLFIDGMATYEYLHILPWLYQVLFTALVPVAIGFLGKYGLTLVLTAISDYVKASKES